jgi:hypothetical protein
LKNLKCHQILHGKWPNESVLKNGGPWIVAAAEASTEKVVTSSHGIAQLENHDQERLAE